MRPDLLLQLTPTQKDWVKKGKIEDVVDLLTTSPQEWAFRWKTSVASVNELINVCLRNVPMPQPIRLEDAHSFNKRCSTGDQLLDEALGGGIRQGMVWEIVGESAAGKTQVALQLALCAQLPVEKGGFFGSTCFLTTSSVLPTTRLQQIAEAHPLFQSSGCGLDHVITQSTPTVPILLHVLQVSLPALIESKAQDKEGRSSIKLLIVDALAELFHTSDKTTTSTLFERSKNISQIGFLLHTLASKYGLAILVLNEVVDSFDRDRDENLSTRELLYRQQSRWFGRPHSLPNESKEASLGLVWANQVNTRIFLSRTGRRRHLGDEERGPKRPKGDANPSDTPKEDDISSNQLTLIRRLTVVFSSVCRPASLDYVVTQAGVSAIPGTLQYPTAEGIAIPRTEQITSSSGQSRTHAGGDSNTLVTEMTGEEQLLLAVEPSSEAVDEWDQYWASEELSADLYTTLEHEYEEEEIIPSTEEQGIMD